MVENLKIGETASQLSFREVCDSAWKEFIESLKFFWESKKGKYSLETYLKIVGEYTNRIIIAAEEKGMHFYGGECSVKRERESDDVLWFQVEVFFKDEYGKVVKKEAARKIPSIKFTTETLEKIGNEHLIFEIEKP
ncbi:hypothetical protein ACTNCH_03525 [Candidatus Merdisoma sp. HCP28S3_D10]|uniref:hypothetical protein n=1 Tax=unclassified Candidatus Merdisoma TaxID=3099611 RepID=UPI003F8A6716